jgi:Zn-dependent peptidase ImmA (M78 family)
MVLALGDGVAGAHITRDSSPLLLVNGRQGTARQRFTLVHEFGHHRLGHSIVVDNPTNLSDIGHDPLEVEANAFAAEFLMPRLAVPRWERSAGPERSRSMTSFGSPASMG